MRRENTDGWEEARKERGKKKRKKAEKCCKGRRKMRNKERGK